MKRSGVRICTEDDDRDKGCVAGGNILRLCRTVVGFGRKVFWVKKMEIMIGFCSVVCVGMLVMWCFWGILVRQQCVQYSMNVD